MSYDCRHTFSIKKRQFSHHIFPDPGCGIGAFSIGYMTLKIIGTITIAKGYTIINTLTAIDFFAISVEFTDFRSKCIQNQKNRTSDTGGSLHTSGSISTHEYAIRMWNKAKKDKTEAPTKEPTRGKAAEAPLLGLGAGAGTSAAATVALTEAAAMRIAQVTFLMSMMNRCDFVLETRGCADETNVFSFVVLFACRSEEQLCCSWPFKDGVSVILGKLHIFRLVKRS
ncbi:hypothetical protein ACSQ67_024346 [Phaseolus vulgaris]